MDLQKLHATPRPADIISTLVYSSQAADVRDTFIAGQAVMRERELLTLNADLRHIAKKQFSHKISKKQFLRAAFWSILGDMEASIASIGCKSVLKSFWFTLNYLFFHTFTPKQFPCRSVMN